MAKSGKENIKRLEKLMEKDHAKAVLVLGGSYELEGAYHKTEQRLVLWSARWKF